MPELERKSVLIVEDDLDSMGVIVAYLKRCGCRLLTATTGDLGLRLARQIRPDLILLDLMLPRISGLEILRELKADPQLQATPVIVLSVVADENRGVLLGEVDCLQKPVSLEAFGAAVRRNLRPGKGLILVVDDDAGDRDLISEFLNDGLADVKTASSGAEALAMLDRMTPDLVFLDLSMPGMDGMETLGAIRRDPRHAALPVVMITGRDLVPAERDRLRESAAAVLSKGVKGETLEAGLKRTLGVLLKRRADHDG